MAKKILAVDDEADILHLVQTTLENEGYEVATAEDGQEALESVAKDKPDLIVLDVSMPELNGFAVLKHLKEDPATADIPVIMLTAIDQDANVLSGRITWAAIASDLYLSKPFEASTLIASVQRILHDAI